MTINGTVHRKNRKQSIDEGKRLAKIFAEYMLKWFSKFRNFIDIGDLGLVWLLLTVKLLSI